MSVEDLDETTQQRLAALLEDNSDVIEYDNRRGDPVATRFVGGSCIQTIPSGCRNFIQVDEGAVPRIIVHPESNGITFLWD